MDKEREKAKEIARKLSSKEFKSRKELSEELNGDRDLTDLVFIELHNLDEKKCFSEIDDSIALFLPHCLRDVDNCEAKRTEEGYICTSCMNCEIGLIKRFVDESIDVYVVPGGSMVEKILKEKDYSAVVGVACIPELELGRSMAKEIGIPSQLVPLENDGCRETSVKVKDVLKKI